MPAVSGRAFTTAWADSLYNAKAEVIDTDFNILPGLFAAGEVCGGVHGMVRLGTVSIADCIVYGRVAGKAAANRKA